MEISEIRDKFIKSFNVQRLGFERPEVLTDKNVGFFFVKEYSKKDISKFKINPKYRYVTKFNIFIKDHDLVDQLLQLKPVIVECHFYNIEKWDDETMKEIDCKRRKPINFISNDDLFYSTQNNIFYNKCNQQVSADSVLDKMYNIHLKPTKKFRGLFLRTRLVFACVKAWSIKFLSNSLVRILWLISGDIAIPNYDIVVRYVDTLYPEREIQAEFIKEKEGNKIDIFGYKASRQAVFVFCVLHLIIFAIFLYFKFYPKYIVLILTNSFLTVMYVLPALVIFDKGLPRLLKFLIVKSTKWYVSYCTGQTKLQDI